MKNSAFTLIELLVVIVIIGILSTISTATFSGYNQKARDTKRLTVARELEQNILTFLTEDQSNDFHLLFPQVRDIPESTGSTFLQRLESNDFQNTNFPSGCAWIGQHSTDKKQYIITYAEESQTNNLKVISNISPSPVIPYSSSCSGMNPPILADYSFTLFNLTASPMILAKGIPFGLNCMATSTEQSCFSF